MSRSDRATVLQINSVGAVGARSVIPAEAGIHATAQPCDEPQSARRPTRAPSAPRVIGRRRTLGVPLTPTDRMDSCLRRNDGEGAPVCRTRSFLHTRPVPHTRLLPSHPLLSVTSASFRHARPVRHSCGGRNPCGRPTVRRASIRPTAHHSPQRAARDRAPSNIGSALGPPQTAWIPACAGMTERRHRSAAPAPSFTPALYLTSAPIRHIRRCPSHPPLPSLLRRQESMRPPNRATSLNPPDGPPQLPARRA